MNTSRAAMRLFIALVVSFLLIAVSASAAQPVVLTFNGGGWIVGGDWAAQQFHDAWAPALPGIDVRAGVYRPGGVISVQDAVADYDALRASLPADTPICTLGGSAGAHLALMVAAQRPVACVVAMGTPTDLTNIETSASLMSLVHQTFGYDQNVLRENSPAFLPISAPILMAHEDADPIIPANQAQEFIANHPQTTYVDIPYGNDEGFVHSTTTAAAAEAFRATLRNFVAQAATTPFSSPQLPAAAPTAAPNAKPVRSHKVRKHHRKHHRARHR